ncbi:MAG: CBS domain-containing protein [Caldisericia bacterium]|nr:CBS domain-containing protein [Caldisericia bacterium]
MKKKSLERIYKNRILTSNIIGKICCSNVNTNKCSKIKDIWFENTNPFPKLIYLELQYVNSKEKIFIKEEDFNFKKLSYTKEEKDVLISKRCFSLKKNILRRKMIDISKSSIFVCGNSVLKVSKGGMYLDKIGISMTSVFSYIVPKSFFICVLKKREKTLFISWLNIQPIVNPDSSSKEWNDYKKLSNMNASDVADLFVKMKENTQADIILSIPMQKARNIIEEVDVSHLTPLLKTLSQGFVAQLLLSITRKKAGWIVRELGKEANGFLDHMQIKDANELVYLSQKDPITAGGIMETKFLKYYLDLKVKDVLEKIREDAFGEGSISYIYVVDLENEIKGILSIQSLILADENNPLSVIMTSKVVTIRDTDFKDDIAVKMEKYHLLALPVVDKNNRIQGIVTIHEILESFMMSRN